MPCRKNMTPKAYVTPSKLFFKMFGPNQKKWPKHVLSYALEEKHKKKTFVQLLRSPGFAQLLSNVPCPLIVLVQKQRGLLELLLDHHVLREKPKFPFCCFVLKKNGQIVEHIKDLKLVPWAKINPNCYPKSTPDEVTFEKTVWHAFSSMQECILNDKENIELLYLCRYRFGAIYQTITNDDATIVSSTPTLTSTSTSILASSETTITTAKRSVPKTTWLCYVDNFQQLHAVNFQNYINYHSQNKKIKLTESPPLLPLEELDHDAILEDMLEKNNRSAAASIRLNGLEMAHQFGLFDRTRFEHVACKLTQQVAFLWSHLDTAENIRHICYFETRSRVFRHWHFRNEIRLGDFNAFFDFLMERQKITVEENMRYLNSTLNDNFQNQNKVSFLEDDIFASLWTPSIVASENDTIKTDDLKTSQKKSKSQRPQFKNNYATCFQSLKEEASHFKIICCLTLDAFLHQLKIPFVFYFETVKNAKVVCKFNKKNTLYALSSCKLTIENIHPFLEGDQCQGNAYHDTVAIDSVLQEVQSDKRRLKGNCPQPIIDASISSITKSKDLVYALGMQSPLPATGKLARFCQLRGEYLCEILSILYKVTCAFYINSFNVFISNATPIQPSLIAFKSVMMLCTKHDKFPFCQSVERFKPAYDYLIRQQCHGGFLFSAHAALEKGDPLFEEHASRESQIISRIKNVLELDLNNSYGSSAASASIPGGFCTGFRNNSNISVVDIDNNVQKETKLLTAIDRSRRSESFEFQMTYYVIYSLWNEFNFQRQNHPLQVIQCVYHNYSPFGLYFVENYPVDLVITLTNGNMYFFQFDGQFAHSCEQCPPLAHFANNQTSEILIMKTRQRDMVIQNYLRAWRDRLGCKYFYGIITDCHGWSKKNFQNDFTLTFSGDRNIAKKVCFEAPQLSRLVKPYRLLPSSIDSQWLLSLCPPELTFLFIGRLEVKLKTTNENTNENVADDKISTAASFAARFGKGGCLFGYQHKEENVVGQQGLTSTHQQPVLVTKDLLHHYARHFHVNIIDVNYCFVFRTWPALSETYRELLNACNEEKKQGKTVKVHLFKRIFNYSCGYFGINLAKNQNRQRATLTFRPPTSRVNHRRTNFPLEYIRDIQGHSLFIKTTRRNVADQQWRRRQKVKTQNLNQLQLMKQQLHHVPCPISLPIFATIIDYGKLQLHRMLIFIDAHAKEHSVRLLYSNTDNLVLGLGECSPLPKTTAKLEPAKKEICTLFDIVKPEVVDAFKTESVHFLSSTEGGKFKEEWNMAGASSWAFVTPAIQTYVVVNSKSGEGIFKMPSLKKDKSLDEVVVMLKNLHAHLPVTVHEYRRQDKTLDTKMKLQQFVFQLNKKKKTH